MVLFARVMDIDTVGLGGLVEQIAKIQTLGLPVIDRRAGIQHFGLADHVVKRPESHLGHHLAHFLGHKEEVVHYVFGAPVNFLRSCGSWVANANCRC